MLARYRALAAERPADWGDESEAYAAAREWRLDVPAGGSVVHPDRSGRSNGMTFAVPRSATAQG